MNDEGCAHKHPPKSGCVTCLEIRIKTLESYIRVLEEELLIHNTKIQ